MGLTDLSITLQWLCSAQTQPFWNVCQQQVTTYHAVVHISYAALYYPQIASLTVWHCCKMCLQITWANEYLNNTYIRIILFKITVQSGTVVTRYHVSWVP